MYNEAGGLSGVSPLVRNGKLTIEGELNSSDFYFIRELASGMHPDNLTMLDISKAKIVTGGSPYLTLNGQAYYITANDVIGERLFEGCQLTELKLPKTLKEIGDFAFSECNQLQEVSIPASVTSIGLVPWAGCSSVTSVSVASGNTAYYSENNAIISSDGTLVQAFNITTGIPNNVKRIGVAAFGMCSTPNSLVIPNGVEEIEYQAFFSCDNLQSVTFPESLTAIGDYAFAYCSSLKTVNLPKSITALGVSPWIGCSALNSFSVNSSNRSYKFVNSNLLTYDGTTLVEGFNFTSTIPSGVSTIAEHAFDGTTITNMTIPEGVQTIEGAAFADCPDLQSISLPSSVTSINEFAFENDDNLTTIESAIANPFAIANNVYSESAFNNATLQVPFGTKSKYQNTSGWQQFTTIFEAGGGQNFTIELVNAMSIEGERFVNREIVVSADVINRGTATFDGIINVYVGSPSEDLGNSLSGIVTTMSPGGTTHVAYGLTNFAQTPGTYKVSIVAEPNNSNEKYVITTENIEIAAEEVYEDDLVFTAVNEQGIEITYKRVNTTDPYCMVGVGERGKPAVSVSRDVWELTIPSTANGYSVIGINSYAFEDEGNIQSYTLSKGVKEIKPYAFSRTALYALHLMDENVVNASDNTFSVSWDNNRIQELYVPYGMKDAYANDYVWNKARFIYEFPNGRTFKSVNEDGIAITYAVLDESAKTCQVGDGKWGSSAISRTQKIEKLVIPETVAGYTVTRIGNNSLSGRIDGTELTLPASISIIDRIGFALTTYYSSVTLLGATPPIVDTEDPILKPMNVEIRVPAGSASAYRQDAFWGRYSNIVEVGSESGLEVGDTFTALTVEGVEMTFKVMDADQMTCQVGNDDEASVNTYTSGTVTIPETVNGYTVIRIGNRGFYECSRLRRINLAESITSIGEYAFYGCTGLTTLDLPDKINTVAPTAFNNFEGVLKASPEVASVVSSSVSSSSSSGSGGSGTGVSIIIKETPKETQRVFIPYVVTAIDERAFSYCESVVAMVVESENAVFDSREGCNAIIRTADDVLLFGCQNTTIPQGIMGIAAYAFEGHTGLREITLPSSISSIGERAFADCNELMSIISEIEQPSPISDNTFSTSVYHQATLSVPYGTKKLYELAEGWKNFYNIVERELPYDPVFTARSIEGIEITFKVLDEEAKTCQVGTGEWGSPAIRFSDNGGGLTIPEEANGYRVVSIGSHAFNNEASLSHPGYDFILPASIRKIEAHAFKGIYLSFFVILATDFVDARGAFEVYHEYGLQNLYVPIGMKDTYASSDEWSRFTNIYEIPTGRVIQSPDISGSFDITYVVLSEEEKTCQVGNGWSPAIPSQYRWVGIESLIIPQTVEGYTVTKVGQSAFTFSFIKEFSLPSSIEEIERYAFYGNWGIINDIKLQSATPPVMDESAIHERDYELCTIHVPSGTKTTYQQAEMWNKFSTILEAGETLVDNAIYVTNEEGNAVFSEVSKEIEGDFVIPEIITDATLSSSVTVTEIAPQAFLDCSSLNSITIPETVTTIGEEAFSGCTGLTKIYSYGVRPIQLSSSAVRSRRHLALSNYTQFNGIDFDKCTLYVPAGARQDYRDADGWNQFKMIEEMHDESDRPVKMTATSYTRKYGEDNPLFEYEIDGITPDGEPLILCDADKTSEVGTYAIKISKGEVKNYNDTYVDGMLTVTKAPLTIKASKYAVKLGSEYPIMQLEYQGWMNDDTETSLSKAAAISVDEKAATEPGLYEVTVGGAEANNYDISYEPGTLRVVKNGDANSNKVVNIDDIVEVIQFIQHQIDDIDTFAADANDDNAVNVADIVKIVSIIMGKEDHDQVQVNAVSHRALSNMTFDVRQDSPSNIAIMMESSSEYTAFQFDLTLPEGIELTGIRLGSAENNHVLSAVKQENGYYRVVGYSLSNMPLRTAGCSLLNISTNKAPAGEISLTEIHFVKANAADNVLQDVTIAGTTNVLNISSPMVFDVYDLNGVLVKRQVTTMNGLAKGVYIVNNEKVLVK